MSIKTAVMVTIKVERVGDHWYAHSDDVPGLNVGGVTEEGVCASAVKAIKFLFKENRGVNVEVMPLSSEVADLGMPGRNCERFVALPA